MIFRDFIKRTCGVCCAIVLMCGANMVEGMEQVVNGNTITITEREQFFQLNDKQSVRSIRIEGQNIDDDFDWHWNKVIESSSLEEVTFYQCKFCDFGLEILNGTTLTSLTVSKCGISSKDAYSIMATIYPHTIRRIDFSENKLGEDEVTFQKALNDKIYNVVGLDTFDLRDNGFSKQFIEKNQAFDRSFIF